MAYIILTQKGTDNSNIDGARGEFFSAGQRDGIVKGAFNEGKLSALSNNSINFDTCELRISGHRIISDTMWYDTFSSYPEKSIRYAVIAQVEVDENSHVDFQIFIQEAGQSLTKDNLFETINGAGLYQVEIGRFTLTPSGNVEDVVRTLDVITGGSAKGTHDYIVIGEVKTNMLDKGIKADVDVENVFDEKTNEYKQTDFIFNLPETAGTVVKVNNIEQENIEFTSDPQTQLNNKVDKETGKGLSTNDYTNEEKTKLGGIEAEANKTIVDSALSTTSGNPVQNKVIADALGNKADTNNVYTKTETDNLIDNRWTFSGGIKFINEQSNDCTILAIFEAPATGTYKLTVSMVKDFSTGNGGLSFCVPTEPSKLETDYVSGWFPSLQGTTMKFRFNMEGRIQDYTFNISMNQNDKLLIIAGHTADFPNGKVSYTCTIKRVI